MKLAFKKILRTLLIGLMLTISGSMARGQSLHDKCVINRAVSPDEVIASCTAKIRSGAESGERLAYVLAIRARAYRFKKDDDQAITDATEAIKLNPAYGLSYYVRAQAYSHKKDYDRAIADYTASLRIRPRDEIVLQERGHVYQAKGDYDQAIANYDEAIKISPNFSWGFNDRCYARAIVGRELQQALSDCNEALRLAPNFWAAYDSRGFTYLKLGEYDKAIADYDAALKRNHNSAGSFYGRGLAKQKKGTWRMVTPILRWLKRSRMT